MILISHAQFARALALRAISTATEWGIYWLWLGGAHAPAAATCAHNVHMTAMHVLALEATL